MNSLKAFCLILASALIVSCGTIEPVTIKSVSNFRTVDALTKPQFTFDLKIHNPNKFSVFVKNMGIKLTLADSTLAGISLLQKTQISSQSDITVPVTMSPSMNTLTNIFMAGFKNMFSDLKKQKLELKGEIVVRKFIFTKKFKISESIKM